MSLRARFALLALATAAACGSAPPPAAKPIAAVSPNPPSAPAAVTPFDPDAQPLPLWKDVRTGVLPNGLTYYVLANKKPEARAMMWLAVNAGSVQEDDDQRGLAHYDEHMAFNGTARFPHADLIDYLEKIGMRFGADLNAYTTWEETVYQLEVPTDRPEFVSKGFDILRDWAGDVSYDPKEVEKESGVVLEEWRLGRGAGMRLFDKHAKVEFAGTRYADRITIGLPEIIKAHDRAALYRFYKDWYRPDLMAVVIVGDVDPDAVADQLKQKFGDLRAPEHPRARPHGGVPTGHGTRVSIETDREAPATTVTISNLTAARGEKSKRDFRRSLGEELYGDILSERFRRLARDPEAPFISASGRISEVLRDVDGFERVARVKNGKVEDALRALVTEAVRIERHGITATELDRAKTNMLRTIDERADTAATRHSRDFTTELVRHFLTGEEVSGPAGEKALAHELLPAITVDELNALAKPFAGTDNRVITISAPDGAALPTKDRVLAIADEVSKAEIAPWVDKPQPTALMSTPPKPGTIAKEHKLDKIGAVEWTLSNGVHVIVKPTDFEVDNVVIRGNSPGGDATVGDADYPSARFADAVASIGGVGELDTEDLGKVLAGKQVRVSTSIGETTEGIDASGSVRDLETMFQLLHLRMTAPRKDPQQFAVWKANFAEQIKNVLRSPEARYSRESQAELYKHAARRTPVEVADLDKVDLDRALAFYKARFGDASDFTFVIVGAVDVDKLKPLVATYLGSLPASGRKEKEKDLGLRKVSGVVKKQWHLGQEDKASVQIDLHADETWTREKERDMFIVGQVLSIKLREVMREDMSGVYGVGAGGSIQRLPHQERSFSLRFGCAPARVDELVAAAFAEIDKLAKDGASDDYLAKVKQTFLRNRETELRTNRFWANWLTTATRVGDDPAMILDSDAIVARMTSANVKTAAKKLLDRKQYYQAVLLPAEAPAPK